MPSRYRRAGTLLVTGIARIARSSVAVTALAACAAQRADTTEADVAAITRAANEWAAAVQAGNLDQIVALFTNDIVLLPPNEPAVAGMDATRVWGKGLVDAVTMTSVAIVSDETVVSGDWAFSRGVFRATMQPKGGGSPAAPVANKYILIWRRQADGSWKIARDIWNGSEPPPAATAPTAR